MKGAGGERERKKRKTMPSTELPFTHSLNCVTDSESEEEMTKRAAERERYGYG